MADSDLSLLLRLKGDSAGAKTAVAETRAAVSQLRSTFGTEFSQIQNVSNKALTSITNNLNSFTSQIPFVGNAFSKVSVGLQTFGQEAALAGKAVEGTGEASAVAGGEIAAFAGPVGIAVVAVGALAAGSFILTQQLFDLAKSAADFRGKMFDLSQQTGVSVELLSTLEVVAKTTGGSIDSIAQSLVIFQGHLDEAQDSASKAGQKFTELGISTANTEQAFTDALKVLAAMPEGFHQTNEAAELFGRRGGKQVLAILKELDGDLPGATAKLRALGLVISNEDAKAADQFNDQLAILNFQFRAAMGKEVIPAALIALERLSALFQENARSISFMGQVLGSFSNTVLAGFLLKLQELEFVLISVEAAAAALDRMMGNLRLPGVTGGVEGNSAFEGVKSGVGGIAPPKRTGGGGRATSRDTSGSDAQREAEQQLEFTTRLARAVNELSDAYSGVDTTTREYAVAQSIANGELSTADAGMQKMALDAAKSADEFAKLIGLNKELADFQKELTDATWALTRSEKGYLEQAQDLITSLNAQGKYLDRNEEQLLLSSARTLQLAADSEKLVKSLQDLASIPVAPVLEALNEGLANQLAGAFANAEAGEPPEAKILTLNDAFLKLGDTITSVFGVGKESVAGFADIMGGALNNLANGIGNMVESYVLLGSAGPQALRKLLAATLAQIAAESAVRAIFELAKGFAALFFNPAEAAAHFTSAALFGSIAGVSAAAGRSVAGDLFKQPERASSGSSRSSGGSSGSSTAPPPIEVNRRTSAPGMTLTLVVPQGWLGNELKKDYDLNGYSRLLITSGT